MEGILIVARAMQFGACLLLFGSLVVDRLVAGPEKERIDAHPRASVPLLLSAIVLSGIAWFFALAAAMSDRAGGLPAFLNTSSLLWTSTGFGKVWQFRLAICVMLAILCVPNRTPTRYGTRRNILPWTIFIFSAVLLASLAWSGHGRDGNPAVWHLAADALHLLVAGVWPGGLLAFAWRLRAFRRSPEPATPAVRTQFVRRFSALSLGSVALLAATGLLNAWFMLGSPAALLRESYGRLLLIKVAAFFVTVAIGAANILRIKPALARRRRGDRQSCGESPIQRLNGDCPRRYSSSSS